MKFSQDHLVAVALWFLHRDGKIASFENLVAETFLSFPERFQLEGFAEWPNANVIGKSWVRCRTDKKWIRGSASSGFGLTILGEDIVRKTLAQLDQAEQLVAMERKGTRQTISARTVLSLEKSSAWRHYLNSGVDGVSEYDFRECLYCTLESSADTLLRNFDAVRQQVASYGRKDLEAFLDLLKSKFAAKMIRHARGGLMTQKKAG